MIVKNTNIFPLCTMACSWAYRGFLSRVHLHFGKQWEDKNESFLQLNHDSFSIECVALPDQSSPSWRLLNCNSPVLQLSDGKFVLFSCCLSSIWHLSKENKDMGAKMTFFFCLVPLTRVVLLLPYFPRLCLSCLVIFLFVFSTETQRLWAQKWKQGNFDTVYIGAVN